MPKGKQPALMLYTGDWLKDTDLAMCSVGTRGVWIDWLCHMHERSNSVRSPELHGTPKSLARLGRCSAAEAVTALIELRGVAKVTWSMGSWNDCPDLSNSEVSIEALNGFGVRPTWVYFVWDSFTGEIKIGFSGNVDKRVSALKRDRGGRDLILLATEPGGRELEREEHGKWADSRTVGEWFVASPNLVWYIVGLPGADSHWAPRMKNACDRAWRKPGES